MELNQAPRPNADNADTSERSPEVGRSRADGEPRRTGHWAVALLAAASAVATGCGSQATAHNSPIPVIYGVKFPGRQEGHAKIRYRLPDGTLKFEDVPLPWESNVLYFRYRDQIVVEAVATDVNRLVPLQCVAISDPEDPKGTTFGSSRAGNCRAKGKAGGHPQSLPT
jgi:hypothetical protein